MTRLLSICIPTYNGGEYFKYNVNKLIDMSLKYNFDICISDNASTDETQEYMLNLITKYDFIKYHRNKNNQGWAYNFDYVLKMADTEYAWLLGDDDEILENGLIKVIEILTKYKPDICVVNGINLDNEKIIKGISSKIYTDKNMVLSDLGQHMSWMSTLIFSNKMINKMDFKSITDNAFPHLIEIFRYFNKCCNLYWSSIPSSKVQENSSCRYNNNHMNYFIKDWYNITIEIGDYKNNSKQVFIRSLCENVYSFRNIIYLRCINILNKHNLLEVKKELKYYPLKIKIYLYIISKIPINLLVSIKKVIRIINRRNK